MATASDEPASADAYRAVMRLLDRNPQDVAELLELLSRLNPRKRKGYRADVLRRTFRHAAEVAVACGWHGTVLLRDGRVVVEQDGVYLGADKDFRFFRKNGSSPARKMLSVLSRLKVPIGTVFDIGANIGEIALYIAIHRPDARVFAFEPGPENVAAFNENLRLQRRPLDNLQLIPEAVSDRAGLIPMVVGAHDLNTVMVDGNADRLRRSPDFRVMEVATDTLEAYAQRLGAPTIDFLKVDVEGGEPLLRESIGRMRGRIRAALFEFSRYNQIDEYLALHAALVDAGMAVMDEELRPIDGFADLLRRRLEESVAQNYWYAQREYLQL